MVYMVAVRLSSKQRTILGLVELQGDLTLAELARMSGFKASTIQYALRSLKDKGVLYERHAMVDLHLLGFSHHTIFFTLASKDDATTTALLKKIGELPHVIWLFELAGRYQFAVSISIRSNVDLPDFIDRFATTVRSEVVEIAVCNQFDFRYFGRRYLLSSKFKTPRIDLNLKRHTVALDPSAERVLEHLAAGKLRTVSEISQATGIPPATVDRRRRELKEAGIIKAYAHWINAEKLGRTCYLFRINVRGVPVRFTQRLFGFIDQEPDVLYALRCLGEWDYELGVELEGASAVAALTSRLYRQFKTEILSIQPIPVLRYLLVRGMPAVRS
jgi:DNA-binding Lrp family transcriptional regulator